jgi:uncharacterized protein (TIGR02231 family)
MMRILRIAAYMTIVLLASDAVATEIEAKSTIAAVTVHPDAATITRETTIDLPAGVSTVVFKSLPFALDPASLQVSGEGASHFLIGAVETRVAPGGAGGADSPVEAKLKSLHAERDVVQVTLDALTAKRAMIHHFSQVGPEKLSPDARPLALGEWGAAFDAIGGALAKVGEELRVARAKAEEIDEEIRALEAAKGWASGRGPTRDVAVGVEARSAGAARLTLTYLITGGAGWAPAYDARLDTGEKDRKPALEFVRRAMVTQRTGEDWSNVALSVSTVRARRGAAAPDVQPLRVAFWEPLAPLGAVRSAPAGNLAAGGGRADATASKRMLEAPETESLKPAPAPQQVAALEGGAYQATFKISGSVDVPGDGSSKSFVLSSRKIEPILAIRAAPALDPTAYLEARVVNNEDAPLLPGMVAVQRDGVFVGSSRIGLVAPGDAAHFGFGADDKVKVVRAPVKRSENEPSWFGQTKTEVRDFKTTIKNLHAFPIKTTIVDQIPFSESTAIVVETLPQTTAPTEKQVADKRGVLGWTFDAQPGETKEIRLAYRVKWPADRDIVTQPAPLPVR